MTCFVSFSSLKILWLIWHKECVLFLYLIRARAFDKVSIFAIICTLISLTGRIILVSNYPWRKPYISLIHQLIFFSLSLQISSLVFYLLISSLSNSTFSDMPIHGCTLRIQSWCDFSYAFLQSLKATARLWSHVFSWLTTHKFPFTAPSCHPSHMGQ